MNSMNSDIMNSPANMKNEVGVIRPKAITGNAINVTTKVVNAVEAGKPMFIVEFIMIIPNTIKTTNQKSMIPSNFRL